MDITVYKSPSVRVATASAAKSLSMPIKIILPAAGWPGAESFVNIIINLYLSQKALEIYCLLSHD